jgi:predicted transcriptional regulator of viral defense system
MTKIQNQKSVESWLTSLLSKGETAFSLAKLRAEFSDHSEIALKSSLNRLSKKNKVLSIHKGYYLIIPPQYSSWGFLPVQIFIDGLMSHLKKPYYIGLLSAAAMHGAAHQQPQEFYVITVPPALRPTKRKNLKINYLTKSEIPKNFLVQRKTETGYIKISSPELTALDLIEYQKRVGGLNRVVTIMEELIEEFDEKNINKEFIALGDNSAIQRLGYLLELITDGKRFAEKLFRECKNEGKKFNRIALEGRESSRGFSSNNRWNVIVNIEIESDL